MIVALAALTISLTLNLCLAHELAYLYGKDEARVQ